MQSKATTIEQYINELPEDRRNAVRSLHQTILKVLPKGFEPVMQYGMISYVVPHDLYPKGYHCKPADPLPFAALASQKNSINIYHMGLYANEKLMKWFTDSFAKVSKYKLDMGKSCVRFKKPEHIPVSLIEDLFAKITVAEWIELYEKQLKR